MDGRRVADIGPRCAGPNQNDQPHGVEAAVLKRRPLLPLPLIATAKFPISCHKFPLPHLPARPTMG